MDTGLRGRLAGFFVGAALLIGQTASSATNGEVAFPGAEGFGRFASGGSGGERVHVTSLEDGGPGSFREAVSKPGRIVVFDVGGTIRLKSNVLVSSRVSLQGETAPGGGRHVSGTFGFIQRAK